MNPFASNLIVRIALAGVAIPALLWTVLFGGWIFLVVVAVIMVLGAGEWAGLARGAGFRCPGWLVAAGALFMGADLVWRDAADLLAVVWIVVIVAIVVIMSGDWSSQPALGSVGAVVGGVWYVSLLAALPVIALGVGTVSAEDGSRVAATLFCMVWAMDILAYFGGSVLGRHKLAPAISPGKSWEGAFFGWMGAILGAFIGFLAWPLASIGLFEILLLGAVVGIVGQVGDLAESMFKRDASIKDSSTLLPGHGGILDRFDSLIFAAPTVYIWFLVRDTVTGW